MVYCIHWTSSCRLVTVSSIRWKYIHAVIFIPFTDKSILRFSDKFSTIDCFFFLSSSSCRWLVLLWRICTTETKLQSHTEWQYIYISLFATDTHEISYVCITNFDSRNFGQKFSFNVHRLYSMSVIHSCTVHTYSLIIHVNAPKATSPPVYSQVLIRSARTSQLNKFSHENFVMNTQYACMTMCKSMSVWIFICEYFGLLFLRIVEFCVTIWFAYRKI